eukprot:COSAG01_NODE_20678_length_940_cov_2.774078_2_plen_72_part_00
MDIKGLFYVGRRPPDRYMDTDHAVFDDDDDDVWSDGGDFNGCDDGGVELRSEKFGHPKVGIVEAFFCSQAL